MISEFITYLQGASLTPDVRYAFTTEPVRDYSDELPVIMVYPQAYSAAPSGADNFVIQDVEYSIVCLLGCAIEDWETLLDELRAAAMGWVLNDYDAMEMAGGEFSGFAGGYLWWEETFTARIRIRQST